MNRFVPCLPVLVVFGCWEPHDNTLFSPTGAQSSLAGVGSSGGSAGSKAEGNAGSGAAAGSDAVSTAGTSNGYPAVGGTAGSGGGGTGSSSNGGSEPQLDGGEASGGNGQPTGPALVSCDAYEAVTNDENGHCYRLNLDKVDFPTAREACKAAGGHLVTVTSKSENDFVSALHEGGEHWLGATDNKGDTVPGVGTYVWVNDEPWSYTDWEDAQPNAKEFSCPAPDNEASCFEHCGFQPDTVAWRDRPCWDTIASVCEWELDPASTVAK